MPPRRPLSLDEVAAVRNCLLQNPVMGLRDAAILIVGVRTGLRIKEVLSLRVRDVIRPDGSVAEGVTVERRYLKRRGRPSGRFIPLHAEARHAIQAWMDRMEALGLRTDPDAPLFPSLRNPRRPLATRSAWRILKRAFRACNLPEPTGTHSLRKTFASLIYEASGHDIYLTGQALGHSEITSTVRYLAFAREALREAILKQPPILED